MDTKNIHLLTSAIKKVDIERSQRLTKLNTFTSATRHLPPEILTEIFRLSAYKTTLREPEQRYYVSLKDILKVGSVCTQWRRVAWGSPNLWTTCLLTPLPEEEDDNLDLRFYFTSLALANCQANSNISIALELNDPSRYRQQLELLFTQYQARLKVLRLYVSDLCEIDHWNQYFGEMSEDLPNLKELWIRWPGLYKISGPAFLSLTSDKEIQSRSRIQNEFVPWRIPMDQLTIVRLFEIPIDQCVHLLLSCQNLVEFHCDDPSPPSSVYDAAELLPVPERPKSLHNIKRLRWHARRQCWLRSREDWIGFLFSSVRFPNLERLFLGCKELFNEGPPSSLEYLFYQNFIPSLRQLRALDLETYFPLNNHICPMMQYTHFDSVEQLYFVPYVKDSELVNWFKMLTPKPTKTHVLFPNLKTVHMMVSGLEIGKAKLFDALCHFLAKRREQNKRYVSLERIIIESRSKLHFDQNQMDILSGFVANGLTLEWEREEEDDCTLW